MIKAIAKGKMECVWLFTCCVNLSRYDKTSMFKPSCISSVITHKTEKKLVILYVRHMFCHFFEWGNCINRVGASETCFRLFFFPPFLFLPGKLDWVLTTLFFLFYFLIVSRLRNWVHSSNQICWIGFSNTFILATKMWFRSLIFGFYANSYTYDLWVLLAFPLGYVATTDAFSVLFSETGVLTFYSVPIPFWCLI